MHDIHRACGARRRTTAAGALLLAASFMTTGQDASAAGSAGGPAGSVRDPAPARAAAPGPRAADASSRLPRAPSGTGAAVIAPITAGLLLTGLAVWRRRGLPGGH
ncbi:hypothetical protein [Streptomyces sp. NPDC001380]|uniref:hypothetical protein n=1 Tax=Streptomyces sp. NPDC001380 TaxID=3364566 RepID=UPI0036A5C238